MPDYSKGKIYKIVNMVSDDAADCYIGSTCDDLSKRFSKHKSDWALERHADRFIYQAFTELGFNNFRIVLLEDYPCENSNQLRAREEHHRITIGAKYNKCRALRTEEDNKQHTEQYRKEHKEQIREKNKQWRENHKEELKEKQKQYYEQNKEEIKQKVKEHYYKTIDRQKETHKQYYEKHKEELVQREKERYHMNKDEINEKRRARRNDDEHGETVRQQARAYYERNRDKILERMKEKHDCECGGRYSTNDKSKHFRTGIHKAFEATKQQQAEQVKADNGNEQE